MRQRFLLLSASMGAGHDAVAGELAARLRARGHLVRTEDVLALLPSGVGAALRAAYRGTVRRVPALYGAVYRGFLDPEPERGTRGESVARPGSAPLALLAERPLMEAVGKWQPDGVVSTFHLSAQVTGRLRKRGVLRVPSVVSVIDFGVHRGWLHPGNDAHLCVTGAAARTAGAVTGRHAEATGPVVPAAFLRVGDGGAPGETGPAGEGQAWRGELGLLAPGRRVVLVSAGAWGVGSELLSTVRQLADGADVLPVLPVLLCGRDERLRRRAARLPGVLALGWVADMAELMSAADALIDNAAGQTAAQALAAGLPVIGHRPLPGHGAQGVRAMADAGVSELVGDRGDLTAALRRVLEPGPVREERIARGRSLFRTDAAQRITELALAGVRT
ncbi:galactosyldiacylglycerol synthase [Streptomyces ovatisporus]|uniref:Galactosyldiacylglycerol synthase n=1 Tax=Streptomyces ovatisporus TaxID=1128682 RepID=A0ABV9AB43_9ACTN